MLFLINSKRGRLYINCVNVELFTKFYPQPNADRESGNSLQTETRNQAQSRLIHETTGSLTNKFCFQVYLWS